MSATHSAQQMLVSALEAGKELDLIPEHPRGALIDDTSMRAWGPGHDVPAAALFELLRGGGLPAQAPAHPLGVRVRGARILGRLVLDHLKEALPLELIDCLLDEGASAYAAHLPYLSLCRCRITHRQQTPFDASGLRVDDDLRLAGSIVTASRSAEGAVHLTGARITGQLNCRGAALFSESGPALAADRCEVSGDVFLDEGFSARGAGEGGALRLSGARITGELGCSGAVLVNESGPALAADRCEVSGDVFLDEGFSARGAGEGGALRLSGARITGELGCSGAVLVNESGPALYAYRCEVGGGVFLDGGFSARGAGDRGAVRLVGVRITGQLSCRGARLTSTSSTALSVRDAEVSGPIYLDHGFTATGAGTEAVIDMRGSRCGALRLSDATDRVAHATDSNHRWNLDGCTYAGLPRPEDRGWWLTLLSDATPVYAAQPYQQLAAVYRAAGHESDVRAILIEQRRDQVARGRLNVRERAWARFTGWVLGYGWAPWRALYGLLAVFLVSAVLAVVLGAHGALTHPSPPGVPAQGCTVIERIGVGLDLGTPLLGSVTRARDRCPLNADPDSTAATALIISTWVLQLLGWGLAALFVAGFTGAVRKT